ncbi:uncharacterized protein LOC106095650 [Stomoxys calcitrans]|uniref:uncharacterized protein LOC106095650 n=1 Tax=Stomoxys calcitrans TaxID=35570 RepID=UPI0027E38592|nr:uncharacterized protein LOC106095650 [Stomoxys calcitrans]
MGARNSTPQTANIDNPKRVVPIEITAEVMTRLEAKTKQQEKPIELNEFEDHKKELEFGKTQRPKVQRETSNDFRPTGKYPHEHSHWFEEQTADRRSNYNEHEEYQFERTLSMLENVLGKPVDIMSDNKQEIQALRRDLIECYKEYPGKTLYCADIAKRYQDFIFRQQYERILEHVESNEDFAEQAKQPPPPFEHFPPYF